MPALIASDPTPSARALMLARGNDARLAAAFSGKKRGSKMPKRGLPHHPKKNFVPLLTPIGTRS